MIQRLSELKAGLVDAFARRGRSAVDLGGKLAVPGLCIFDWRETTGPVTEKSLDAWVRGLDRTRPAGGSPPASEPESLVLMTMGHLTAAALGHYLESPDLRRRLVLLALGLRHYFEETPCPEIYAASRHDLIVEALLEALGAQGLAAKMPGCSRCEGRLMALCAGCGARLCRTHVLICPICRARFCHPDDASRRCYHGHGCES